MNQHPAPGSLHEHEAPSTRHQAPESDTLMTATYVKVLIVEAVILGALWFFGRMFS